MKLNRRQLSPGGDSIEFGKIPQGVSRHPTQRVANLRFALTSIMG